MFEVGTFAEILRTLILVASSITKMKYNTFNCTVAYRLWFLNEKIDNISKTVVILKVNDFIFMYETYLKI